MISQELIPSQSYFFAFCKAHKVPKGFVKEYYSHCKKVSWLDLFGKPIQWQAGILNIWLSRKNSPHNPTQGGCNEKS